MAWLLLSLACGLFTALQGASVKKALTGNDHLLAAWSSALFSVPWFALFLFAKGEPIPRPPPDFYPYLGLNLLMLALSLTLYFKSIQVGEFGRDVPLLSLTPIFMIFTSRAILGQALGSLGVAAILVVVAGCLVIQKQPGRSLGGMFAAPFRERGSRLMLMVALIWSVSGNVDKLCVDRVGPWAYALIFNGAFAVVYIPVLLAGRVPVAAGLRRMRRPMFLVGLFTALLFLSQMSALAVAPHVAYVITLKRGGLLLFSVLGGALWFGERHTGWRLVGSAAIFAGLLLLALEA